MNLIDDRDTKFPLFTWSVSCTFPTSDYHMDNSYSLSVYKPRQIPPLDSKKS